MLILLLSLAVSLGWWKNENKHGSIWIQNDQELKALSLWLKWVGERVGGVIPLYKPSQGLQILLMSGVSVTSASQILESFWNIWSQVSDFPAHGPLTWKAEIHDGGH